MFEVYLSSKSLKTLQKLDKQIAERMKEFLLNLKTSPLPVKKYDLKKISGMHDVYRARISSYRIIYAIDWEKKEINVIKIAKRSEGTYKKLRGFG